MKLFELKLKKNKKGVFAMSLVNEPAILVDFIKLSKSKEPELQEPIMNLTISKEQKIITGPAMIPNFKILKLGKILNEERIYTFFSEKTVKQAAELFMTNEWMNNSTLEHDVITNDLKLIESWIVNDPKIDKALTLGFNVPKGTWMWSYKVVSDELWNRIVSGEFNGFSIEARGFDMIEREMEKELTTEEASKIIVMTFMNKLKFEQHDIPEAEQDWIYMIHHMHPPLTEGDMEEVHHCILWTEENEKGDSFETKHVKDNKVFQHALDIENIEEIPEKVYDHLNNKYPVQGVDIDNVQYAIINKPKIKIKHED